MDYEMSLTQLEQEIFSNAKIQHYSRPILAIKTFMQNGKKIYLLAAVSEILRLNVRISFRIDKTDFETALNLAIRSIENTLNSLKWKKRV